jgi:hypothetical protein
MHAGRVRRKFGKGWTVAREDCYGLKEDVGRSREIAAFVPRFRLWAAGMLWNAEG